MSKKLFTIEEMENIFEIGRNMQAMEDNEEIEVEDSKEAFVFALQLATKFEEECPNTEDYYFDLDEYAIDKIKNEFGVED